MTAALVDRARGGDREAFAVLVRGAVDRSYTLAGLILHDQGLAEDAVQEAFIRAWRDLASLRDADRFDAWLYRLVVRSCADIGRRRRRWRAEVAMLASEPAELDATASIADRDQLERSLRRLTGDQRAVLVLHFYLGMSPAETATALGIPVGTAKSRLHYALAAMRAAIDADERTAIRAIPEGRQA